MATITETNGTGRGVVSLTETTLTGTADTFTYRSGSRQLLILRNATAGALSPVIDGDGGTTVSVDGLGVVTVSGGYAVGSIPAGEVRAIPLDTIKSYLAGTIAITSATGIVASIIRVK